MSKPAFTVTLKPEQLFIYMLKLDVRISDINYGNHMAATALPALLQQTRLKFLKIHDFSEQDVDGTGLIISDIYTHYCSEVFFADELAIHLGIDNIAPVSSDFVYQIKNITQNKLAAIAKERIVFFDYQRRKITKTPAAFISVVQQLEKAQSQHRP